MARHSLYDMWLAAHDANKLPDEWNDFMAFRAWAMENKYKAEYGYKGEFNPESLGGATPTLKSKAEIKPDTEKALSSEEQPAAKSASTRGRKKAAENGKQP